MNLIDVTNRIISVGGYGRNGELLVVDDMTGRNVLTLGEYLTRERAIEILDEIEKAWNRAEQTKAKASDFAMMQSFVYRMPEE